MLIIFSLISLWNFTDFLLYIYVFECFLQTRQWDRGRVLIFGFYCNYPNKITWKAHRFFAQACRPFGLHTVRQFWSNILSLWFTKLWSLIVWCVSVSCNHKQNLLAWLRCAVSLQQFMRPCLLMWTMWRALPSMV